ncbi:DUF6744 family protein [Nonomuraea sp. NPDC050790]|uniref:DUF6744 family protein n=1 Tax=Nonomuraea sp. NPDC050790 TaxID=3364371 RepID=UPI003795C730
MSTPSAHSATPANTATGTEQVSASETLDHFAAYATAMENGDTPVLGHLVLYSIFDGRVTRDDLHRWFLECGLDDTFLPPPIRESDAFERVTGPAGVRTSYRLADSTAPHAGATGGRRRRDPAEKVTAVTLMVRHVSRDDLSITRHLVREVRDEGRAQLSYDTCLAELKFWRDPLQSGVPGRGRLQITPHLTAINQLSVSEQAKVTATLDEIKETYGRQCRFYTSDRLRAVIRTYVEGLNAVRVRASGGVYFVHRAHAAPLAGLRALTAKFGAGSHLARVPLPDQEEMREMVIAAFTTKAKEDLDKLALDIADARANGTTEARFQSLYNRFQALQASTSEHSELLSASLDDTKSSLQMVHAQFANLFTAPV